MSHIQPAHSQALAQRAVRPVVGMLPRQRAQAGRAQPSLAAHKRRSAHRAERRHSKSREIAPIHVAKIIDFIQTFITPGVL